MEKQKMTVTVEDNEENEETKTIKTTNTPLSPPSTRLPFSSASNSHAYCFVCKRPGPKLVVVPTGERYNIFLQTEIIVPAGARCCPNHLMDGKLSQEAMHSVRTTRQDAFFNRSTLAELLRFLREAALKSQTSRIDFDNTDALADEEYKTLLGLDKEQFADILKYVQLKNTPSRTSRCTLAIFL
ncbi:hypothetical protein FSP39_024695 [Pinctada imbricata]|uniref:Uncharacterized protein n=1 Tax=Pinctada imbricata TaxID=66713 RepID=A0AA88Y633_PINIB|nr:hypothetical protein FSP39_024695 [Pinctada imbricata]